MLERFNQTLVLLGTVVIRLTDLDQLPQHPAARAVNEDGQRRAFRRQAWRDR